MGKGRGGGREEVADRGRGRGAGREGGKYMDGS